MSSKSKEETLKRSRGSNSSISSDRPLAKKAKESGGFDYGASEKFYNNITRSTRKISRGEELALQATLSEIPVGVRQPPQQATRLSKRHFDPLYRELKHSRSFDYPASLCTQNLSSQGRLRHRRSFQEDSGDSSDPIDLLGQEDKERRIEIQRLKALRERGSGIVFAGSEGHHQLNPDVKGKGTIGFATTRDGSVSDEETSQDTRVQSQRRRGGLPSSLYFYKTAANSRPSTSEGLPSSEAASVPIKGTSQRLSPGDTTDELTGPKDNQKQALLIDSDEDDVYTLNDRVLDVGSSEIPAEIEIIQEDLPSDLRGEAAATLDSGRKKIEAIFGQLGLPLSPDRIPRDSSSRKVEYHTASTVTQATLEEHGSWEFDNTQRWKTRDAGGKRQSLEAVDVYVPIELDGDMVDIMDSPASTTTPEEQPDLELHSNVQLFLDGRKDYIEHPMRKLYLADDIATEKVLQDRVTSALLMPVAYKAILDLHERRMQTRKRNQDAGLDSDHEEELLPTSSPLRPHEDYSPKDVIPEDIPEELNSTIAEQFIQKHNLKPTLRDAQRLQEFLMARQSKYARRASHQRLCEMTGTAAERKRRQDQGKPIPFSTIAYVPRKLIEERDKQKRAGNAMANEHASDPNFGAAERVLQWATFQPLLDIGAKGDSKGKKEAKQSLSEVAVETHVGPLVKGIFWGHKHLKESENKALRFLHCLRLFGTDPKADYAARLSGEQWKIWGILLALCLFSGECKPSNKFSSKTEAQLAMNSVAALIMIIIMHLSTRKSPSQKLLPWMFLYAFVYTEEGITIYAHFPKMVIDADGKSRWKFVSWRVSNTFESMWTIEGTVELRMRALAAVYLMRSHTEFVLEQLLAWSQNLPKSAIPIMETLIARAEAEMEVYKKVLRRLHAGVAKRIET